MLTKVDLVVLKDVILVILRKKKKMMVTRGLSAIIFGAGERE